MAHELIWQQIHEEREALLADLEGLSDAQWQTASLCDGWTVQQVLAHLVSSATTTKAAAAKALLTHKGDVQAMIHEGMTQHAAGTPAETLAEFRDALHERTTIVTPHASLGETIVHGEDIRKPLGIEREYPAETLRELADYYKDTNVGAGAKKRIEGVQLMATDQVWKTGEGQVVSGPMLALIMTMTGRTAYLDQLSGDGLAVYSGRFEH